MLKMLKFFAIWYPAVGSVTSFFVLFGPIVFQKRELPLTNFVPDFPPYIFLYILQGYSFLIVYFSIIFFDILFGTLLMMIVIQWKFLNRDIKRVLSSKIETRDDRKLFQREVKKCIDYHIFLIDYVDRINGTMFFSNLFFIAMSVITYCLELFILLTFPPGDDFLIHITLLMGLTNEYLLFYVIPGQLLSIEAENTENSAFSSNWYESSTNLKKPMVNMISNISRKSVNLTAAKLFDFTFENALKSYKLVFSYYMFLKTMNIGQQEK
ncbi:uncharacterized protein [Diabrotica undecimpunctata]|uniref:uncharacterized protein n=1 Tax=Diabrotica undecimpunctata TaxID=50387 RepID=UPI003B640D3A